MLFEMENVLLKLTCGELIALDSKRATEFILPRHYSGRRPVISKAFGWYVNHKIVAVATFGKPASPFVCDSICGKSYSDHVYELNRMCRLPDLDKPLSIFVGGCLKYLKQFDWIVVSYSDSQMSHHGYIYQATNFMFTGKTELQYDMFAGKGLHTRHNYDSGSSKDNTNLRVKRFPKYRYLYFCTSDKKLMREWKESLRFEILPYPKGDNKNYILGEYIKQVIVDADTKEEVNI